jgi:hypothetical protein
MTKTTRLRFILGSGHLVVGLASMLLAAITGARVWNVVLGVAWLALRNFACGSGAEGVGALDQTDAATSPSA